MSAQIQRYRPWLALFRPPNFLTVPGDVVAGYLLATGGAIVAGGSALLGAAIGAALCLYGAGLLLNDWVDAAEDRRDRPDRPIPSGAVSAGKVLLLACVLSAAGLLLGMAAGAAAFVCALLLTAAVAGYNFAAKHRRVPASLIMGVCRGLSVLLGSAAAFGTGETHLHALFPVLWGGGLVAAYIAVVTWLAHNEAVGGYRRWEAWLPVWVPLAAVLLYLPSVPLREPLYWAGFVLAWALFFSASVRAATRLSAAASADKGKAAPVPATVVPPLIGLWIGALMPIQGALVFASGETATTLAAGIILLCFWPVQRRLARWFYSS